MDVTHRESLILARYAMHSADTAGRKYSEPEHAYRGPFQRDRDRVLHSAAFRRLSGKMQVFTGEMGDYHRTRLTHTMEVASIARTMARAMRLNEDLVETLALLHDIGHPPFGHAGEDALAACLEADGGFSHNRFALTLVEELEDRYPEFPGLNLSREVLDGQVARTNKRGRKSPPMASDGDDDGDRVDLQPLLEVQLVDLADSIAYNAHDVDDAMVLGLVNRKELLQVPLASRAYANVEQTYRSIPEDRLRQALVRELIDIQVSSVMARCLGELESSSWQSAVAAQASGYCLELSDDVAEEKRVLERFLYESVYRHSELLGIRRRAQQQLADMFEFLVANPQHMSKPYRARAGQVGSRRAVADYIAGMTDRYCYQRYAELIGNSD